MLYSLRIPLRRCKWLLISMVLCAVYIQIKIVNTYQDLSRIILRGFTVERVQRAWLHVTLARKIGREGGEYVKFPSIAGVKTY